jgi:hypothetical protein
MDAHDDSTEATGSEATVIGTDAPAVAQHWHEMFGGRARTCESCGAGFTLTNTVNLGGCFIHRLDADWEGTYRCCGYNPYRPTTTPRGHASGLTAREMRNTNHSNAVGCLPADHHTAELRRGSRAIWGVPVPMSVLALRRGGGRIMPNTELPASDPIAKNIYENVGREHFVVVNGCHAQDKVLDPTAGDGGGSGYRRSFHSARTR